MRPAGIGPNVYNKVYFTLGHFCCHTVESIERNRSFFDFKSTKLSGEIQI